MGQGQCLLMILGGLLLVLTAARILIPSASAIAIKFHVPEDIIATTLVAFGTSLPELTTAIASVRRGHPEIAVGNVVGADVLNCLFVIGSAATASPLEIPMNFTMEFLEEQIHNTIASNKLENSTVKVRLLVHRNEGGL